MSTSEDLAHALKLFQAEVEEMQSSTEAKDAESDATHCVNKRPESEQVVEETAVLSSKPTLSKAYLEALEQQVSRKRKRPAPRNDFVDDEEEEPQNPPANPTNTDGSRRKSEINTPVIGPQGPPSKRKVSLRTAAGKVWEDPTLSEWPENDFRLWVGQLGPEATDGMLTDVFSKYSSFNMARAVVNKRTSECRGFGFVSFSDPMEMVKAMRENQGKYCGNRRMMIKRSQKEKRDLKWVQRQEKKQKALLKKLDAL